jgi:hypothetical protein
MLRRLALISFACSSAAAAQAFSIGLLGGANFNDVVKAANTGTYSAVQNSSNFTIGPSFRVNLPAGFRLEVDALYRPYGFTFNAGALGMFPVSAQQWRFPVLAQYRLGSRGLRPFVEAGVSFNHLAGISDAAKSVITSGPGVLLHQTDAGLVIGGGVDVKVPFVRLSGELRYTRQTLSDFANVSNLNQAEVLFGVRF